MQAEEEWRERETEEVGKCEGQKEKGDCKGDRRRRRGPTRQVQGRGKEKGTARARGHCEMSGKEKQRSRVRGSGISEEDIP